MRKNIIKHELHLTDGSLPGGQTPIAKHLKMASNPFRFFRGSANVFYADIHSGQLAFPEMLTKQIPVTTIMGDCHLANFGFLTEEGSHGDSVIFAPNDFDDACVGYSIWDIGRFIISLILTQQLCSGIRMGRFVSEKYDSVETLNACSEEQLKSAINSFFDGYLSTCQGLISGELARDTVLANFPKTHALRPFEKKALKRSTSGKHFLTKSALAKATEYNSFSLKFKSDSTKYKPLSSTLQKELIHHFAPYVNDTIIDVVERLGAGTGSVNMQRFYLLVGPNRITSEQDVALCHIVEIKQQREAAPLHHFAKLSPINRLNPAHLTVNCQRLMQRKPDLVLDEVEWQGKHWLVRSRHHARVSIAPEEVAFSKEDNANKLSGVSEACGRALALSHSRGDRRSTNYEKAVISSLPEFIPTISEICFTYAQQVNEDMTHLRELIEYASA